MFNDVMILREKKYDKLIVNDMVDSLFNRMNINEINKHDTILIKPNLMYYWDASTGETTDPLIIDAIISKLSAICGDDINIKIIESDASAMKTKYVFKVLGYDKFRSKNVDLVNLSEGEHVFKEVMINNNKIKIKINKILTEGNYLINVPKIKIHRNPPILTCALKNNFGLISTPYKFQYHKNLSDYIQAINQVIKNDLIIVDGLVVLGKGPKKMGVLLGAHDPIICDVLVSKICGINPKRDEITSKFITKEHNFKNININDPNNVLNGIYKDFPHTNPHIEKVTWDLLLFLLDLYAKIVGDIKPPVLE